MEDEIVHALKDTTFCLKNNSGICQLKYDHAYYYPVCSFLQKGYS